MSHRAQRSGLGRFDVLPAPIVRSPARNPDGSVICPECGQTVTETKGTPRIRSPDLADRDLRQKIDELQQGGEAGGVLPAVDVLGSDVDERPTKLINLVHTRKARKCTVCEGSLRNIEVDERSLDI